MRRLWAQFLAFWSDSRLSVAGREAITAELGRAGERAAEDHLRANGLRVLARNWRNPDDTREEIDLVCEEAAEADGETPTLVFVEVKARAAGARVAGYHAVHGRKKAVLLRACRAYLARVRPPPRHLRFDVVEISHGVSEEQVARFLAMRLDPALASRRGGRLVWHYRGVPLFPDRATHRHG